MHIPDGFLDTKTLVATAGLSAVGVGIAWNQTKASIPPGRIPLLGVSAAFIFAAQMLNFPIVAGTSGHLTGAVLAVVLLGAAPAVIVMTSVLLVQCFMFADGGVLALGANVFNMAIVGTLTGFGVYRGLLRAFPGKRGRIGAVACASWCSVVVSSLSCAGELAWSNAAPPSAVFPAMAGVHALIGIGEAFITAAVVGAVDRARPDLFAGTVRSPQERSIVPLVALGCIIAVGLVLFVSPFASQWPDGLDHVARVFGFDQREVHHAAQTPMPGYQAPWINGAGIATIVGGIIGLLLVFFLTTGLVRMFARNSTPRHPIRTPKHR